MDFENYFGTSPATVNSTIKKLEEIGLISKEKGIARSIKLTIDKEELPELEQGTAGNYAIRPET